MQTIWKGTISFGLVNIPVRLHAATQEHGVHFHQVHEADGGRVRYRRTCEKCGKEIPYSKIAKGYEAPDGSTAVLTDQDFADLPIPTERAIQVLAFTPAEQIDPGQLLRAYYLAPDRMGERAYVLLRDALVRSGLVAVVKVALRQRESLAMLRVHDDVLTLHTMLWPDEIRGTQEVAPPSDVSVRPQELAMAESYIQTLTADFDPDAYTDDYRHALEEVVAAKLSGRRIEAEAVPAGEEPENVIDLVSALKASLAAARGGKEERPSERTAGRAGAEKPAKKAAAGRGGGKQAGEKAPGGAAKKAAPARSGKKAPAKRSAAGRRRTA